MIGILEYLAAGTSQRQVLVAHAVRPPDAHPLRTVQRDLVDALPNADLELWYGQPSGDSRTGALTVSAPGLPAEADIYLCGGAGCRRWSAIVGTDGRLLVRPFVHSS